MALPNDQHALKLSFGSTDARTALPDSPILFRKPAIPPSSDRLSSLLSSGAPQKKRSHSPEPPPAQNAQKKPRLVDLLNSSTTSLDSASSAKPAQADSPTTSQTRTTHDSLGSLFQSLGDMDRRRREHSALLSSFHFVLERDFPPPSDNVKSDWLLADRATHETQAPWATTTWATTATKPTSSVINSTTTPSSLDFTGEPTSDQSLLSNSLCNRHDKPKESATKRLAAIYRHRQTFEALPLERKISRIVKFRKFADSLDVTPDAVQRLGLTEADFSHYQLGDRSQKRELSACERAGCTKHTTSLSGVCGDHLCIVFGCTSGQRCCSFCQAHYQTFRRFKRLH